MERPPSHMMVAVVAHHLFTWARFGSLALTPGVDRLGVVAEGHGHEVVGIHGPVGRVDHLRGMRWPLLGSEGDFAVRRVGRSRHVGIYTRQEGPQGQEDIGMRDPVVADGRVGYH